MKLTCKICKKEFDNYHLGTARHYQDTHPTEYEKIIERYNDCSEILRQTAISYPELIIKENPLIDWRHHVEIDTE